jgi:capsule polysaccharide export protein KpsE/RkpR
VTPPRSVIGSLAALSWLASFRVRAVLFGILIFAFVLLAAFPERYRAAVTVTPTDPQSLGLSGALGQLGALNSVFGNQAAVEVAVRVGQSFYVRNIVIDRANLQRRMGMDRLALHRWLDRVVTVRSLRGGIVLIELQQRDAGLARDIVATYAAATQERLAQVSQSQTAYKRKVLMKLVSESATQLGKAQDAYDVFRMKNRNPSPLAGVLSVTDQIASLDGAIKAKQVALATARKLYTDQNNVVVQIKGEIEALRGELAKVQGSQSPEKGTAAGAIVQSSELFRLERELTIQRALYDSYLRFLQGTAVEDLTSTANVRVLEPPFVDTQRQFWWPAVAAALAIALLWGAIEFYRLRPPVGASDRPVTT